MKKIKSIIGMILCTFILVNMFPMKVQADMGPKPSVVIEIVGLEDEVYYGTLLSHSSGNGPYEAISECTGKQGSEDYEIWKAFVEYEDSDNYYFFPEIYQCQGTDSFCWDYYPPSPFKILLYFPEYDIYVVSEIYEEYAFDSYYRIDLSGIDFENATSDVNVKAWRSYDYVGETINLIVRIILTILVELAIARIAKYTEKKQFRFIIVVNVITQILMNVRLNMISYHHGGLSWILSYNNLEMLVFLIEAVLYAIVLPKISEKEIKKSRVIWYAFFANLISFFTGLLLAGVLPKFF